MEINDNFQTVSICSQLNLKIQDLNVQDLLDKPIYRRLYNIVLHDKNRNEYHYRKNLIKQLYFMLKITPIMKPELQNTYLQKLEAWYNLNDHKKTQLGSGRLKNLVQQYFTTKQEPTGRKTVSRPQSGINWNKNVNPFLRPYTAKRPNNYNNRPESHKSKFGRSTHASTKLESCEEITIKDYGLSIQQQWQVSQDFINNNRTIHPESEPIYEQLFNLIKNTQIGNRMTKDNSSDNENELLFQKDKEDFFSQRDEVKQKQNQKVQLTQNYNSLQKNQIVDIFDKVSEQSQKDDEDQNSEQNFSEKKIYLKDQNIPSTIKMPVQQFQFFTVQNKRDKLLLKKANNKYLHVTNNKFVNYSKDDHELARNHINYTRAKSAMKKQFNRKSQTKRLLSAKTRSNTKLITPQSANQKIFSALPQKNESQNVKTNNFFDFSDALSNKQNDLTFIASPKYNQRLQLDQIYRRPVQKYKKFNKTISVADPNSADKNLMTKYQRFLPSQKINPISDIYIQRHNMQALDEIERIKQKVGNLGKNGLSTDSLMKALYINSYNDFGSCKKLDSEEINLGLQRGISHKQLDWRNRNPFFNMISDGSKKKMKKKHRKLKKK